jgi:hypothetical protein
MGINLEALQQVKESKINDLLISGYGKSFTSPKIIGEVTIEETEDFNFIMFDSTAEGMAKGVKRYNFAVYSYLYFDCYYKTSNVIDMEKVYTMQEFKQMFNNYLKALHTTLQQYI